MEWCRSCGGRLADDDQLCPWCRTPVSAAGERRRDRLHDPAPYTLDEIEDEFPHRDEGPAFAHREPRRGEAAPGTSLEGDDESTVTSVGGRLDSGGGRSGSGAARPAPTAPSGAGNGFAAAVTPPPARPSALAHEALEPAWHLGEPTSAAAEGAAREGPPFLPRALAFIVDLVLLGLVDSAIFMTTLAAVGAARALGASPEHPAELVGALFTAGQIGIFFGYFGVMHSGPGQTLGKALVGLRVVALDGRDLPMRQSMLRAGAYAFSALPLGFGFLIAMMPPGRALHDYVVGSRVVRTRGR